jgi:hypothetical protein
LTAGILQLVGFVIRRSGALWKCLRTAHIPEEKACAPERVGNQPMNESTSMSTDPVTYLASLCEIQGIKYRIEDEGRTLRLGVGTIVLPSNANSSVPIPSSLTVIAGAVRTAQTLHPKPFNP